MRERLDLAATGTPMQPMQRLGAALGFEEGMLWVKRDDLTGLVGGGNKARKLEYLLADALDKGCDVLVTGGAPQSNHVRATAAAAAKSGLRCVAVLAGDGSFDVDGNLLLDELLGAEIVWSGEWDAVGVERKLAETCLRLESEGARPYEVPLGGASEVGTLGYVAAAEEIARQAPPGAVVYTASGTGGTQAGLVVGFGHHSRVVGVDVGALEDLPDRIDRLVAATASAAEMPMPDGRIRLDRDHVGPGYGVPSEEALEAIALVARTEGLVLDPVYSAKAMAALIDDSRSGRLQPDRPVVFLHTGGLPSVFSSNYAEAILRAVRAGGVEPPRAGPTGT
ncbi:MAG: D-cysteine desulfhydrase [Acidimicrobiales bacterium]|nr:MAG: D-cysteine desulfhydrase [Acidimicrobiales bacterium]